MGDMPVEALFPEGWKCFELGSAGWSRVLGIDAVGGPPHRDFANEGVGVSSRCSPDWRAITLAGVILNLAGDIGNQLRPLCQVAPPERMGMERWWNAWEPGQRTRVDRRELWEPPGKNSGHVACGFEVASAGGCQHVAEWVFTGFRRQREQVCPAGRPSRFVGESGDVLVGFVELCDGLGSDQLFGCEVEAVGVALDRLEQPGCWIVELAQQGAGGDGRFIAGDDLLQRLGRGVR